MPTRSQLMMIVASSVLGLAMPLCATTASSAPTDASSSMLVPTNVLTDAEREVPKWTLASITEQNAFTSTVLGDNRGRGQTSDGDAFFEAAAVVPPDQPPSEARVPEPATLIFVGTGLIGIAKASRKKRPEWKFRNVTTRLQATAVQEV